MLEPEDRGEVEVVRGLVQEKDVDGVAAEGNRKVGSDPAARRELSVQFYRRDRI